MKIRMTLTDLYAESQRLLNDTSSVVFLIVYAVYSSHNDDDNWEISLKEFRPTGRWRLKTSPTGQLELYLEHRGLLFNKWVNEDSLILRPPEVDVIYNCHN